MCGRTIPLRPCEAESPSREVTAMRRVVAVLALELVFVLVRAHSLRLTAAIWAASPPSQERRRTP